MRRDLSQSVPDQRLNSEVFTGKAWSIPRGSHSLEESHVSARCPHDPTNSKSRGSLGCCCGHHQQGLDPWHLEHSVALQKSVGVITRVGVRWHHAGCVAVCIQPSLVGRPSNA